MPVERLEVNEIGSLKSNSYGHIMTKSGLRSQPWIGGSGRREFLERRLRRPGPAYRQYDRCIDSPSVWVDDKIVPEVHNSMRDEHGRDLANTG